MHIRMNHHYHHRRSEFWSWLFLFQDQQDQEKGYHESCMLEAIDPLKWQEVKHTKIHHHFIASQCPDRGTQKVSQIFIVICKKMNACNTLLWSTTRFARYRSITITWFNNHWGNPNYAKAGSRFGCSCDWLFCTNFQILQNSYDSGTLHSYIFRWTN
jgi:hypothetical protein